MKISEVKKPIQPGDTFGMLMAVSIAGRSPRGGLSWNCVCDCGKVVKLSASRLATYKSCGCNAHPNRPDRERFEEYFEIGDFDDCWNWLGGTISGEYGQFGSSEGSKYAHRVAYELYVGPVTDGLYVCHSCDNPSCVNPNHLFLGTQKDNIRDMDRKGRRVVGDMRGEKNGNSKLTEGDVREIKELWATGNYTIADLARMFLIGWTAISDIVKGQKWIHVN